MPLHEAIRSRKFSRSQKSPKAPSQKLSRQIKPPHLSLEEWQIELRRQFGRTQSFQLKNVGDQPIFSEFRVHNPKTKSTYQVLVRGRTPGDNHCTCGDFATN